MNRVILVGMMGAGKSTVGAGLASVLGTSFVDLDREVERELGEPVATFWARRGEAAFRAIESRVLRALPYAGVVATGGGTLVDAANLAHLRATGRVVYLRASVETLLARVDPASRPLLAEARSPRERLFALLAERTHAYEAAHVVVDTDGLTLDEVVARVLAVVQSQSASTTIRVPMLEAEGGAYDVVVASSTVDLLAELRARVSGPLFVLADETVADLHGSRVLAALGDPPLVRLRAGEACKTLSEIERVAEALLDAGARRDAVLVALGGGATCDSVGFLAATYLRGVASVYLPTTLLAMVDAAIGGKTAVNLARGKNLIGAVYPPRLVVCELTTLATLSPAERRSGLAEVLKHALLEGEEALAHLAAEASVLRDGDTAALYALTLRAIVFKGRIVAADPYENVRPVVVADERSGSGFAPTTGREILNLGHTVAHALEADALARGAAMSHGDAVAIGLLAEARIGAALGHWPLGPARVDVLLSALGLPSQPELEAKGARFARAAAPTSDHASDDVLRRALLADKKVSSGAAGNRGNNTGSRTSDAAGARLRLILLAAPGRPIAVDVDGDRVLEILRGEKGG